MLARRQLKHVLLVLRTLVQRRALASGRGTHAHCANENLGILVTAHMTRPHAQSLLQVHSVRGRADTLQIVQQYEVHINRNKCVGR